MASPLKDDSYRYNPHNLASSQRDYREGRVGGARPKTRGTIRTRGKGFHHHSSNEDLTGADIKHSQRTDLGRGWARQESTGRERPIHAAGYHRDDDRKGTKNKEEGGDKSSEQQPGGYQRRAALFYSRPQQSEGQSSSIHRSSDVSNSSRGNKFRSKQPTNGYLLPKPKEGNASALISAKESTNVTRKQGTGVEQDPLTSPPKPHAKCKTTAPPIPEDVLQSLLEEDPSDILKTFVSRKDEFLALLGQDQLTDDVFMLTLKVLSCISELDSVAAVKKDLNIALSMVDSSSFLSKHMSRYVIGLKGCGKSTDTLASEVELVLKVVSVFLQHKPSGCEEVGVVLILLETVVTSVALGDEHFDPQGVLMKEVQHLSNIFTQLEKAQQSTREKARERQPPDNFRSIPIFPDGSEIRRPTRPFLRKNIIKGKYDNVEHYLDVQFRLLREDFVAPLREGVAEYLSDTNNRLQDIRIYRNAIVIDKGKLTNSGFVYTLQFDVSGLERVQWESSKRLIYGSFVCLTKDDFQNILCATVENRSIEGLQKGKVEIRFLSEIGNTAPRGPFIMAESAAYFEACRHMLQGLQQMTPSTFPFKKFIVEISSDVNPPAYLGDDDYITYDLGSLATGRQSSVDGSTEHTTQYTLRAHAVQYKATTTHIGRTTASVPILRPMMWPSAENLHLDESQKEALRAALTKEFAIIQGPPGTGKTYIGLKIIQILLRNKPRKKSSPISDRYRALLRNKEEDHNNSPILVVCLTNHALDQFLEGIVAFGEENVIRVGGRSSSEVLKSKNLTQIRRDRPHRRRQQNVRVDDLKQELRQAEKKVQTTLLKLNLAKTVILSFHELKDYLSKENFRDLIMPWIRGENIPGPTTNLLRWLNVVDSTVNVPRQPRVNSQWRQTQVREDRIHVEDEGSRVQQERCIDLGQCIDQPSQTEADNIAAYDSTCIKRCGKNQCSTPHAELQKQDCMTDEEVYKVKSIWPLKIWDRWRLYRLWTKRYIEAHEEKLDEYRQEYEKLSKRMKSANDQDDVLILEEASVIGMTTTGAARLRSVLQLLGPRIVIVEEAAEVLEAHIITALTTKCQHLILIGDHQQLKPNPTVYRLAKVFNLDTSLFERMINNGLPCQTLSCQHRMRPEISKLMKKHFYKNLHDDESVMGLDEIKGVAHNMFFIDHNQLEDGLADDNKTKSNQYEAEVLVELCRYLLHQGYKPTQITILATYLGQRFTFKKIMDKETFEGVRVSVVDNFQGEENDIILLSLVRSNAECSIGFLKTSNRVCVALSRARMGFYCIGNASILKKAQIWQDIIGTLEAGNQIGSKLRLVCQNHPDKQAEVASANDFRFKVPQGGCGVPCEYILPCGHGVCELPCHPYDRDHKVYKCKKPCIKYCDRNEHPCPKKCYDECRPCNVKVTKIFPDCGHEIVVYCCNFDSTTCIVPCTEILECGHSCEKFCSQPCTLHCRVKVKKTLPCGHSLTMKCCQDPTEAVCKTRVMKVLPICGHELFMRCSQEPKHDNCSKPCEKTLQCGHKCQKKCGEICIEKSSYHGLNSASCAVPCMKRWKVGHLCVKHCSQPRTSNCRVDVKKTLSCGHSLTMECRKDPTEAVCKTRVLKVLPICGHELFMSCSQEPKHDDCLKPCEKTLQCGHKCQKKCGEICIEKLSSRSLENEIRWGSLESFSSFCLEKCEATLPCGHPCPNKCGEPCSTPEIDELYSFLYYNKRKLPKTRIATKCLERVQRRLSDCGHSADMLCYQDVDEVRCQAACTKLLACDHPCTNRCHQPCSRCNKKAQKTLPCGHIAQVPCSLNVHHFKCNKKCDNKLACGHQCPNQCCDPCPRPGSHSQFFPIPRGKTNRGISARCEVSVQKTLPNCHHTVTIPCYRDTTSMRCAVTCNKILACNHRCTNKCGAPCRCKLKVWKRFLTCKHSLKLPCDRNITHNDRCRKCRK